VILAFTDGYFWNTTNSLVQGELGTVQDFENALARIAVNIREAGHDVIVVFPIHRYNGTKYTWERFRILDLWSESCDLAAPYSYIKKLQSPTRLAISRVSESLGLKTLDFQQEVCNTASCPIKNDNIFIFADEAHISKSFSKSLSRHFSALIQ
jgi:hypothetical protein